MISVAALLAGCGSQAATSDADASTGTQETSASPVAQGRNEGVATLSDRYGPSWRGHLGDTVQVDWFDQTSGETHSERIAVLSVKRLPNPGGNNVPNEFGDDVGPYEWKYALKVRLTSLDASAAQSPAAYQFLELSDGEHVVDGVAGLGKRGGPDPSHVGTSSVGWLYQWAEEGFAPTEVLMPIGAWQARWSLR